MKKSILLTFGFLSLGASSAFAATSQEPVNPSSHLTQVSWSQAQSPSSLSLDDVLVVNPPSCYVIPGLPCDPPPPPPK